jgi:hypothetical protein
MKNNSVDYSKKSPRRDVPMVEIELESVTQQCVPNGWLVNPGVNTIRIYEDEVPEVQALTRTEEDNDLYKRAQAEYARRFKRWADENCDGDMDKAAEICPLSVESVFLSMNEGLGLPHVKPFKYMKITNKGLPPPQEERGWKDQNNAAEIAANAIAGIFSNEDFLMRIAEKVADLIGPTKAKKGN